MDGKEQLRGRATGTSNKVLTDDVAELVAPRALLQRAAVREADAEDDLVAGLERRALALVEVVRADYLTTKGAAGETGLEELYQANMWKKGEDAMKDAVKVGAK